MKVVYVCSPWRAADPAVQRANRDRAERICREVAMAGDVPVASHLLYPQFLDDADPMERGIGLRCALALLSRCDEILVYENALTEGMAAEIAAAAKLNLAIRRTR